MMTSRSCRRGFALFAALVTTVLVSAFVAGAWMLSLQRIRAITSRQSVLRAAEAAERAAVAPLDAWSPGDALGIGIGAVMGPASLTLSGGAAATWRMQRLGPTTFLSQGEGFADSARRAVTWLYRLTLPSFDTAATLTVRDSVLVRSGGRVSGADVLPPTWAGLTCALQAPAAGAAAPDSTHICDGTCGAAGGSQVLGRPARLADTTAADSTHYTLFHGETWATLTSRATAQLAAGASVTPAPVLQGAQCDRSVSSNWGDPSRASACADYFPIIWAHGDVVVQGGRGQGILLADGDVRLDGGTQFTGVIISRDDIRTGTGGAHVWGRVLAQDRDVSDGLHPEIGAGGFLDRSTCAVARAVEGSAALKRKRAAARLDGCQPMTARRGVPPRSRRSYRRTRSWFVTQSRPGVTLLTPSGISQLVVQPAVTKGLLRSCHWQKSPVLGTKCPLRVPETFPGEAKDSGTALLRASNRQLQPGGHVVRRIDT
ncbi:MAG: hypothetical protein U0163_12385 [Gemmatimonadaceae bacterium]